MVDYEGEKSMKNKNNGKKFISCYEDECKSTKDKSCDYEFEFDIDETDECFTNELKNTQNKDYEEVYGEGCKDGYEKALLELLYYMKKNKCCIKCKPKCRHSCKLRNINKCCIICKHNCKSRSINKNKCFHKMR